MENVISKFNSGDILHGKNNRNIRGISPHYIIFLGPDTTTTDRFMGAMLTSSSGYSNIALEEGHFEKYDENKKEWKVFYKKSFISSDLYHKKIEWAPFTKVGQLTNKGLQFVLNQIGHKSPIISPLNQK